MPIPNEISIPSCPRFLPAPDQDGQEMYITCTAPLALLWVRQTTPAQIYIIDGPQEEELLRAAGDWWREYAGKNIGDN